MTPKGAAAIGRLKCFDGVPFSLNAKKKMVIPDALKAVRLRPRSKYCVLGDIAMECGWTKRDLIDSLEMKRTTNNHTWYTNKTKRMLRERKTIRDNADIQKVNMELAQYGY